jgi:hypothetical protein
MNRSTVSAHQAVIDKTKVSTLSCPVNVDVTVLAVPPGTLDPHRAGSRHDLGRRVRTGRSGTRRPAIGGRAEQRSAVLGRQALVFGGPDGARDGRTLGDDAGRAACDLGLAGGQCLRCTL